MRFPAVLLLLCLSHLHGADAFIPKDPPEPDAATPGRFQIISTTVKDHEDKTVPLVIRIDTATGKTWSYLAVPVPMPNSSKPLTVMGWVPLWEDALGTAFEMNKQLTKPKTNASPAAIKGP